MRAEFDNRVVPIRMTGGSAETHWTTKARARKQVNNCERLLFQFGRRRHIVVVDVDDIHCDANEDDEGEEENISDECISPARQSSTVPAGAALANSGRGHFHFSRFLTDAAVMALNSSKCVVSSAAADAGCRAPIASPLSFVFKLRYERPDVMPDQSSTLIWYQNPSEDSIARVTETGQTPSESSIIRGGG